MSGSEPWKTLGRSLDQSLAAVRNPDYGLLVARDENAGPIGFMLVHLEGLAGSPYIKSIAVTDGARNGGLGTRMLRFADVLFRRRAKNVFLSVSSFNAKARGLYERLGYSVVGEFKDYIVADASELLMCKEL